jgi:hypothetical protein
MRREFLPNTSNSRQLYYSGVDRRYHLFGATEGWLEVAQLVNGKKDLETRFYDTNGDGYFDTWEVFLGDNPVPVRTTRVLDPKASLVHLDRESLAADYNHRILPQAIADDQQLIVVMQEFVSSTLAHQYEERADIETSSEARRYLLDIARELYFLRVRDALYVKDSEGVYPRRAEIMHAWDIREERLPVREVFWHSLQSLWHLHTLAHSSYTFLNNYTVGDSVEFWRLAGQIQTFVDDYGKGDFVAAAKDLDGVDRRILVAGKGTRLLHWLTWSAAVLCACLLFLLVSRSRKLRAPRKFGE